MEIKVSQINNFINYPPKNIRVILFYGPDHGLIIEYIKKIINNFLGTKNNLNNITRINSKEIISSSVLLNEYFSISMFGNRKILWLFDDVTKIQRIIKKILDENNNGNTIIIEGKNLKKTSTLVKLCTKHKLAISIPCYHDNQYRLGQLIFNIIKNNCLKISNKNIVYLQSLLGNDRILSRNEINKLVLYCIKKNEITTKDINLCITNNNTKFSFSKLLNAIIDGKSNTADKELTNLFNNGNQSIIIFAVLRNYFYMLHDLLFKINHDKINIHLTVKTIPSMYFNYKNTILNQIKYLSINKIDNAIISIAQADINSKINTHLTKNIINRLIIKLSLLFIHK